MVSPTLDSTDPTISVRVNISCLSLHPVTIPLYDMGCSYLVFAQQFG